MEGKTEQTVPQPVSPVVPDAAVSAARTKFKKLDVSIPYLATPGSIKTALERIRSAATPDRVTGDFVETKLQIKGGQGSAILPYLKKIGLVASNGSPTSLYRAFRNPATGGAAIASAIKLGYKPLGDVNEYFYELDDQKLRGLIVQVTGSEPDSASTRLIVSTLKAIKEFASFDDALEDKGTTLVAPNSEATSIDRGYGREQENRVGLNLAYTINLNLPATADQAVFNAIFRSLKENLLSNE